ncbi:MAG: hypothetical protein WCQ95_00145 [Bacteroidota bacterium]
MEKKKKLRCPIGVPAGIIAALIGLTGVIYNIIIKDWWAAITSFGLLLLAMPFVRIILMVHSANDRLDELESKTQK